MRLLAEDEVVQAGVNSADRHGVRTHLLYTLAYVLDHVRVEHSVSILETRIIVASIYLTARVHDKHRDGKTVAVFLNAVLSRLYLAYP